MKMVFTFFMGLLLLITIGGISRPSTQALSHVILTVFCLVSGLPYASNEWIIFSCIGLLLIVAVFSRAILVGQSFHRSLKMLFSGIFIILVAISLVIHVLPPSVFRLEYGIVFSVILIGIFYSILSTTKGGQIVGTLCVLDALTLVVGLNSQFLAFITLLTFYAFFLFVAILITRSLEPVVS